MEDTEWRSVGGIGRDEMERSLSGGQWRNWLREGWRTMSEVSGGIGREGWRTLSGGQWRELAERGWGGH
ncbi:unnamed protein product [Staurois parvus]|uniref:Uncharacterized protein n=1 Tax=Staurois parvus TaxID=386267 RepID=A0ABN9GPE3_9NEOB|nr:unnamed protein product [Staurois parvus]